MSDTGIDVIAVLRKAVGTVITATEAEGAIAEINARSQKHSQAQDEYSLSDKLTSKLGDDDLELYRKCVDDSRIDTPYGEGTTAVASCLEEACLWIESLRQQLTQAGGKITLLREDNEELLKHAKRLEEELSQVKQKLKATERERDEANALLITGYDLVAESTSLTKQYDYDARARSFVHSVTNHYAVAKENSEPVSEGEDK